MVRKLSLLVIVFFIALVLAACNMPQVSINSTAAPATTTELPQPMAAANTATPILNLVDNTLYLGKLEGQDAIFITNKSLQNYQDGDVQKNSPTAGAVTLATKAEQRYPFEFKGLENPQYLFTLPDETFVTSFLFDGSHERLFVSLVSGFRNDIYQFTPATRDYQKIWTNEMDHSRYGSHKGLASFVQAAGNYLVLAVAPCDGCDGTTVPPIMVVLNISTGTEKALEGFGNVSVNVETNKVSYQKLEETKTACDPSPGCNDGFISTYTPAGDVIEDSLP